MGIMKPFNFQKWINENKHLLQPPVGAQLVFQDSSFIIMVVGGPNRRSDYHVNETEEFFYQLKGHMVLKTVVDGKFEDVIIEEGDIFLLPANTPHSPQRFADTVGLVVEQKRAPQAIDRLRWYCDACKSPEEVVYEESFHLESLDLGKALSPIIQKFYASDSLRTCPHCGFVNQPPPQTDNSSTSSA